MFKSVKNKIITFRSDKTEVNTIVFKHTNYISVWEIRGW